MAASQADTSWFVQDRFGLFLHWGLYSLLARHEWVMNNESILPDDYRKKYLKRFDPDLYNPTVWADAAANAGMKYFVITTKHHEGFCLWDSKLTDFKATNTPASRDLIRPMIDAFRAKGFRTGLYHSLLDWSHPQYEVDEFNGPYAKKSQSERDALNVTRDHKKYIDYLHGQVRELLTDYGQIDLLWFDFSFKNKEGKGKGREHWGSEELVKMIRQLQPRVMVTDRLDLADQPVDFKTPEQATPRDWPTIDGQRVVWESCQTLSGSWGYHRDESSWRSTTQLVQTLIDCVSKGGNFLLNVGPTARGEFDARALDRLQGIGKWMHHHSRSIYGCTQAPPEFITPQDCRLTYNPVIRRLYLHLFAWPYKLVPLDGAFKGRVEYAQLLNDASEVGQIDGWHSQHFGSVENSMVLNLPQTKPDVAVPVVELFLKDE